MTLAKLLPEQADSLGVTPLLLDLCQFEVESVGWIEESEALSRGMFSPVEVATLAATAGDLEGRVPCQ